MFVKVFLICAAMVAVCMAQEGNGCDSADLPAATKIFKEHCPDFYKMLRNTSFYGDCIQRNGFPFYDSSYECGGRSVFGSRPTKNPLGILSHSCNRKTGAEFICCLITTELKTKPGVQPEKKYTVSKECIKEFFEKYPRILK